MMKKTFKKIREIFWPILEGECHEPKQYCLKDLKVSEKHIDESIEYVKEYLTAEKERSKTVETKSSIFIGAFSVATTVMINLVRGSIKRGLTKIEWVFVTIAVFSVVYLCRAILYSIASLRRKNYRVNAPYGYIFNSNEKFRDKKVILVKLCNIAKYNENITNQKVDDMNMAQLFFKKAVICVLLLTLIMFVVFLTDEIVPVVWRNLKSIIFDALF